MRQKGGFCSNPSPKQFMTGFNHVTLSKLFKCSDINTNCENVDWGQLILDVKSAYTLKAADFLDIDCTQTEILIPDVEMPKDLGELNSSRYVFGFVVKKVLSLHDCTKCRSLLVDTASQLDDCNKVYSYLKNYDTESNFGSLTMCSNQVYEFLNRCENCLASVFIDHIHKRGCGSLFINNILSAPGFPQGCCDGTKLLVVKVFVTIRLYYILKFTNQSFQSKSSCKNIKYLKFSHMGC